jgi:hypothetical protein
VRSSSGPGGTWFSGDRGLHESLPKLLSRRQPRLNSIMPSAKVSTGQAAWKPPLATKVAEDGDSRTERSVGCSWCRSVAEVGQTHLPSAAVVGPKLTTGRRVSLTWRLLVDKRGRLTVGERVRGERERLSKEARASLLRLRDRGSNQRKASWFPDCHGPKPTRAIPVPGRSGVDMAPRRSAEQCTCPATEDVRGLFVR